MRIALLWFVAMACTNDRHVDEPGPMIAPAHAPQVATRSEIDARFVTAIRDVAASYAKWGRVDEEPNIAPLRCEIPGPEAYGSRGKVHMSEAVDSPHGRKLYYLWASDRAAYRSLTDKRPIAIGFSIVKESFAALPSTEPKRVYHYDQTPLHDSMQVGGQWLTTGAGNGLYVMTKVGPADGTDAGWIYGTIMPGGELTSAGRVASCIGCHEDAPHERLFGLKASHTR